MKERDKPQSPVDMKGPSRLRRWRDRRLIARLVDPVRLDSARDKAEEKRRKAAAPHTLEFFHQVADPYCHLTAQCLVKLEQRYDVRVIIHLLNNHAEDSTVPPGYALADCQRIAPFYGLDLPQAAVTPPAERIQQAQAILCSAGESLGPTLLVQVGELLWGGDDARLGAMAEQAAGMTAQAAERQLSTSQARLRKLPAHHGANLWYASDWYAGPDRLYHLENRLTALGARNTSGRQLVTPRQVVRCARLSPDTQLALEMFICLDSPDTSIIFDRTVKFARDAGLKLVVRPVYPTLASPGSGLQQGARFGLVDTAREARAMGMQWGDMHDPRGKPVTRACSLLPWSRERGKQREFISAFLRAAFAGGIDTGSPQGLRSVVKAAGLSWDEAKQMLRRDSWRSELRENGRMLEQAGFATVPFYRLRGAGGRVELETAGQDRLWLVARYVDAHCVRSRYEVDGMLVEEQPAYEYSQAL